MDFMEGVQIKNGKQIIYTVYGWDKNFQSWIYKGKKIATSENTRKIPQNVGDEIVVEVNRINKNRYNDIDRNFEIQMFSECSVANISLPDTLPVIKIRGFHCLDGLNKIYLGFLMIPLNLATSTS